MVVRRKRERESGLLSQEVELESWMVSDLPSSMVLPTGRTTLRMTALLSSCITDPRGTYKVTKIVSV